MFRDAFSATEIFQKIDYVAFVSAVGHSITKRSISFQFSPKIEVLQTLEIFLPSHIYNDGFFYSVGHYFYRERVLGIQ